MHPIVIGIISVAALGLLLSGKKTGSNGGTVPTGFLDAYYKWLWNKEGGLAFGNTAGDADLDRSPCLVNGQNPHTSRGITWEYWVNFCNIHHLEVECAPWLEFSTLSEPNNLWKQVVTYRGRLAANLTSIEVLQRYLALWYFGGWDQSLVSIAQVREIITNRSSSNKMKLRSLVNLRKQYFDLLQSQGRANAQTAEAWKNRAESFYTEFSKFV